MTQTFRGTWTPTIDTKQAPSFCNPVIYKKEEKEFEDEKIMKDDNTEDLNLPRKGERAKASPHEIDASNSRLIRALMRGKLQRAWKLCEKKPKRMKDKDKLCKFPAIVAACGIKGSSLFIEYLLNHDISPNITCKHGNGPLRESMLTGDIDIVKLLISSKADVNYQNNIGETPMYIACQTGFLEGMKYILDSGARLGIRLHNGATNLTAATSFLHYSAVEWLLKNGEDPNLWNKFHATPFLISIQKGNIDIARLLLHYKADVNIPMENGHTPLIISIQQKQMKVFNFLLSEPSINVNQKNDNGFFPLFLACQNENIKMVKSLLHHSADINMMYKSYTSLDVAKSKKNDKLCSLLSRFH